WLPIVLGGLFIAIVVAALVWLLLDPDGEEALSPETARAIAESEAQLPAPRSTSEERSRWQAALDADTALGYRRFMTDYPDSVYLGQAQVQLNVLDERAWTELSAEDSPSAYKDYLEQFPDGLHQAEAMARLDEIAQARARAEREAEERERRDNEAWQAARTRGTLAAIEAYLAAWPAGLHTEEAETLRRRLKSRAEDDAAFESAANLDTRAAYRAYIDAFPQGDHVSAALAAMDDLVMRPGRRFRDCEQCPEMVVIAAGRFEQGSPAESTDGLGMERPPRTVTIPEPFAAGIFEVTLAQWDACYQDGGCTAQPDDNGWGRGRRPVIMVSWTDTQEYLQWLSEKTGESYRLPSESEWEYMARAGETGQWLGGSPEAVCEFGNVAGEESGFDWRHQACGDGVAAGTTPAGAFRANAFGLYDVIGNVAEWTADCMNLSYLDAPVDGSAWGRGMCGSHMTRGGSWLTGSKDIRLASRFNLKNGDRNDFTGFRVVRRIDER
ncbi:MAG: SUMF1/EgtB/PvdO family nonheme iron enzyme, partial [Xanthomonadales bacterium]|nr:SUMF1/EgtB/PvdO family nonheme iron enzyme [Xanthomonadales bacterium]